MCFNVGSSHRACIGKAATTGNGGLAGGVPALGVPLQGGLAPTLPCRNLPRHVCGAHECSTHLKWCRLLNNCMSRSAFLVILLVLASGCLEADFHAEDDMLQWHPHTLLLQNSVPDLLVEIDYVAGREPSQFALNALRSVLENVTDKRIITILEPTEIPPTGDEQTFASVERAHREHFSHGGSNDDGNVRWKENGTLHILYLDGQGDGFSGVYTQDLGVAILPDYYQSAVLIGPYVTRPVDPRVAERAVLMHEVGHALGLVNCGIPMVRHHHDDGVSPCHSNRIESVMRYGYGQMDEALLGMMMSQDVEPVWQFDEYDLEDIQAFIEANGE